MQAHTHTLDDPSQASKLQPLNAGELNACKFDWYEGKAVFFPCISGKCYPTEEQKHFSEFLCYELNEQIPHDGRWRVVMRSPVKHKWDDVSRAFRAYMPTVIEMQYLDADGDPQFVTSLEEKLSKILDWGFITLLELAEAGYTEYKAMMQAMNISPEQTIKAAQGQKATNELEQYAID